MWIHSTFRFIRLFYLFFYMLWEKIKYLNCNLLFVMKIVPVTIDFYNITKIWKRSRMLLKKLYFIVLFAFRLMSIKYTLTCAQHMWACNTTWNINNKNAHLSTQDYFLKKNPLLSLIKRGRWRESFPYNSFKATKVNNKYYCIHFNDEKNHLTIYLLLANLSYQRK